MAIRTQQPKITLVSIPILEAPCPCVNTFLWTNFLGWVDMVYIKRAVIVKTTINALTPKLFNQRKFAFPISRMLMYFVTIFIPIVFSASIRTKPYLTVFTALFTFSIVLPSVFQIAFLVTVFTSAFFNSVRVNHCWLTAPLTFNFNRIVSHWGIIPQYTRNYEPKYFDIACERIEQAQKQGRLFA